MNWVLSLRVPFISALTPWSWALLERLPVVQLLVLMSVLWPCTVRLGNCNVHCAVVLNAFQKDNTNLLCVVGIIPPLLCYTESYSRSCKTLLAVNLVTSNCWAIFGYECLLPFEPETNHFNALISFWTCAMILLIRMYTGLLHGTMQRLLEQEWRNVASRLGVCSSSLPEISKIPFLIVTARWELWSQNRMKGQRFSRSFNCPYQPLTEEYPSSDRECCFHSITK
jgi:hypothetical protein